MNKAIPFKNVCFRVRRYPMSQFVITIKTSLSFILTKYCYLHHRYTSLGTRLAEVDVKILRYSIVCNKHSFASVVRCGGRGTEGLLFT